jgi:hypothetical protein
MPANAAFVYDGTNCKIDLSSINNTDEGNYTINVRAYDTISILDYSEYIFTLNITKNNGPTVVTPVTNQTVVAYAVSIFFYSYHLTF